MSEADAAGPNPSGLSDGQIRLLSEWLGPWSVVEDHTWPLQETTVLRIRSRSGDHIVKASESSHHIAREIDAHDNVLDTLVGLPVPRLQFADVAAGMLVTAYLPGRLVLGGPENEHPDVFEQAGAILARLQVPGAQSADYADAVAAEAATRIDQAEGLVDDASRERLARMLAAVPRHPVRLHFTHGDYQPRNWLVHDGRVAVIDFGRAGQRSWVSDLIRLQSRDFFGRPELEAAFLRGLGREPDAADRDTMLLETLREAIATVVWAHGIGDDGFEEHGRVMIRRLLDE